MQTIRFMDGRTTTVDAPDLGTALRRMASINSMTLRRIDLTGRDLSGLDLSGITFDGCGLDGADFTKADLTCARFVGRMAETVFRKAVLLGADLRGIEGRDLDFTGALLDMADFRTSTHDGIDLTKAVWRVEELDGAQSARWDAGRQGSGDGKYSFSGSLPAGADPFGGALLRDVKVERDRLPETHEALAREHRMAGIGGFLAGMAKSKPAKVVGLGVSAVGFSTIHAAADGRVGRALADGGAGLVATLKSTASTLSGWAEAAMNAMVPGTAESASLVGRLGELGMGPGTAWMAVGVGAIGVMAGASMLDRVKPQEKLLKFVTERCKTVAERLGIDDDLRRYVAHRARLVFSSDRKALSSFRDLVDGARENGCRMLSHAGGYFMVCDRTEFSMALRAMREHARFGWSDPSARPTTVWLESHADDPAIPAALTFVPTEGAGVEVMALWRDAGGRFAKAAVYDGFGDPVREVAADGTLRASFAPEDGLHALFGRIEGRLEGVRFGRLDREVRDAFRYDPATHSLTQTHDGIWVLRHRDSGVLDNGTGDVAVHGRRKDGRLVSMSYDMGSRVEAPRPVPFPPAG